jgi:hypothetical protein
MPKQSQGQDQNQDQQSGQEGGKAQLTPLPKALQKRVSMKWVTIEALGKLVNRFRTEGTAPKVVFLTAWGQIEGRLNDIQPSYAESFEESFDHRYTPDIASMVTHMRTELLRTYEEEEKSLELADVAPILSLSDVVLKNAAGETSLQQFTLFADQVIGFTLTQVPELH